MARKNGNGGGTRPRKGPDGRWEARYWAETPTGRKRRSAYESYRKEVADKLAAAMTTKVDAPVAMPINITVSEFLNRHLEVSKETLKRRTWESRDDTVRVHLIPTLGHLKLKELTREHIQYLYTTK